MEIPIRASEQVRRREAAHRCGRPALGLAGHNVIVVDDGLATGSTMRAALRGVRRRAPKRLVLAVPVAPPDTLAALATEVDEIVCLHTPAEFDAVGRFYRDFEQTSDEEVVRLLADARHAAATARIAEMRSAVTRALRAEVLDAGLLLDSLRT